MDATIVFRPIHQPKSFNVFVAQYSDREPWYVNVERVAEGDVITSDGPFSNLERAMSECIRMSSRMIREDGPRV